MRSLCVINDTHIGAIRSGGTTPVTALALRQATLDSFRSLLARADGSDILINGDLFDTFMVPLTDLWEAVNISVEWARRNAGCTLFAARGNHDIAKNSTLMSSFDLYVKFMSTMLGSQFVPILVPLELSEHDAYVVPHMANQDLFNEALKAVPKCKHLFVHANYDNKFAIEADHSLNVSPEQARELPVDHIIFGHEHQRRDELKGKVVIVGNQIPTSVADCLGNDAKYLLRVKADKLVHEAVWDADVDFLRVDWRALSSVAVEGDPQRFIRVQGEASKEEATQVVAAIAKLRKASDAFVITNAVAIDGVKADDEVKLSLEAAKGFDVLSALYELLDEGFERDTVKNIVEKNNVQTATAD
jgi:metallophosphoesterase superfamily enzyme